MHLPQASYVLIPIGSGSQGGGERHPIGQKRPLEPVIRAVTAEIETAGNAINEQDIQSSFPSPSPFHASPPIYKVAAAARHGGAADIEVGCRNPKDPNNARGQASTLHVTICCEGEEMMRKLQAFDDGWLCVVLTLYKASSQVKDWRSGPGLIKSLPA